MNATTKKNIWTDFLKFYSEQNKDRLTRLGVFEYQSDVLIDYWLEAGLPFTGIDLDTHGEMPTIEIMLNEFVHPVKDVKKLKIHFDLNGNEEGLDILDASGRTTILRFENSPADES